MVKLHELAFTSHVYNAFTNYNADYLKLLEKTNPALDLDNPTHRQELIDWLNQWGCRQFALDYHLLASEELQGWYGENRAQLPPKNRPLWELSPADLAVVSGLFNSLVERTASYKVRNGEKVTTTFGPTGASKILFALRPHAMIPWDAPIRVKSKYQGSGSAYEHYLRKALEEIESLQASCQKHGISLEEVPRTLKRIDATVAQLVGEYFWVTLTRECCAPPDDTVKDWARWSQ